MAAYLSSVHERYRPGPDDRFTQLFDLTFDLSVHDMFLCWGAGAALYCPPENLKMAPRDFVRRNDLTFWFRYVHRQLHGAFAHATPGGLPKPALEPVLRRSVA